MIMVNWQVWSIVLFLCLGGFIFGYDVGSVNGVKDMSGYRLMLNLSSSYNDEDSFSNSTSCDSQDDVETVAILGLIVSLLSVGSLFGAVVSGIFSDRVGRKPAILFGACLTTVGGILHTAAINLWMILLSRLVGGIGFGLIYQAIPLYVAEISPEQVRGRMLGFFVTFSMTGFFVGILLNVPLETALYGWRISLGVEILLGAILVLGMLFLPRSPRWLVKKHKHKRALKVLVMIYKDQRKAELHLEEIKSTLSSTKESILETLKYLLQWKILQRLLIGVLIMFISRFTGFNFIMSFSVSLFCGIGLPGFAVSIALAGASVLGPLLTLAIVDRLGRKPLLLIGLLIMCVTHMASAVIILVFKLEDTIESVTVSQTVAGYFVLMLQCLFLTSGTSSIGNVSWVLINEMFPIRGRGFMTSLCNTALWSGIVLANQVSPVLVSSLLNMSGTLLIFAAVSFAVLLFILLTVPETKGYSLEQMDKVFLEPWAVRTNVWFYLRCGCLLELVRRRSQNYHLLNVPEEHPLVKTDISDDKTEEESLEGSAKDRHEDGGVDSSIELIRSSDSTNMTMENHQSTLL